MLHRIKSCHVAGKNKQELFGFLAQSVTSVNTGEKQLIATKGVNVLNSIPHNTSGLSPCSHEEADTRMLFMLLML